MHLEVIGTQSCSGTLYMPDHADYACVHGSMHHANTPHGLFGQLECPPWPYVSSGNQMHANQSQVMSSCILSRKFDFGKCSYSAYASPKHADCGAACRM